jgi:hypothetical protein
MALRCSRPDARDEPAAATPVFPRVRARRACPAPCAVHQSDFGGGKAQRAGLAGLGRERGIEPVTLAQGDGLEAFIQGAVALSASPGVMDRWL